MKLGAISSDDDLFFKPGKKIGCFCSAWFIFRLAKTQRKQNWKKTRTGALWAPSEVKLPFMPFAQKTVLKQLEQMVGTPLSVYLYPQR